MRKLEVIKSLEAIEGNPQVKIFDHLKCYHRSTGEDGAEGVHDFEVSLWNNDLSEDEKQYVRDVNGVEPQPFIALMFDNEDFQGDRDFIADREKETIIDIEVKRMEWALETFPTATALTSLKKLKGEVDELEIELLRYSISPTEAAKERCLKEYVDVLMCFNDSFGRSEFTIEELTQAYKEKLAINVARKWKDNGDGTYSHVKEETNEYKPCFALGCSNSGDHTFLNTTLNRYLYFCDYHFNLKKRDIKFNLKK